MTIEINSIESSGLNLESFKSRLNTNEISVK